MKIVTQKKMAAAKALKKIKNLTAAIVVSVIAFFELCFTARADCAWRLARTDSICALLPSRSAGAKGNPEIHRQPRLRNHPVFIEGMGVPDLPPPILKLSRMVCIGMYSAMLIFLVFCFTAFVASPNGRSFHLEDGNSISGIAGQSASGTATEGPSSTPGKAIKLIVIGCLISSYLIILSYELMRRIK